MSDNPYFCCTPIENFVYEKLPQLTKYCITCYNIFKTQANFNICTEQHFVIWNRETILHNCTNCRKQLYHYTDPLTCPICYTCISKAEPFLTALNRNRYYCCKPLNNQIFQGKISKLKSCHDCATLYDFYESFCELSENHQAVYGINLSFERCVFCLIPLYKLQHFMLCASCEITVLLDTPTPTNNINVTV